jgi:hypothetical protein
MRYNRYQPLPLFIDFAACIMSKKKILTFPKDAAMSTVSELALNALVITLPILGSRLYLGSFLPGLVIPVAALVLWYGVGLGLSQFTHGWSGQFAFGVFLLATLVLALGAGLYAHHAGLGLQRVLITFLINGLTWALAFYYGGIAFTHKFK